MMQIEDEQLFGGHCNQCPIMCTVNIVLVEEPALLSTVWTADRVSDWSTRSPRVSLFFNVALCASVGSAGVFAFFFFSGRVKAFENTAPTLNYYWVPILASPVPRYL